MNNIIRQLDLTHLRIFHLTIVCEQCESQLAVTDYLQPHKTIESMELSRPEYWSGQPFPSPGDLPNPGIIPRPPTLQANSLPAEPQGKPKNTGVGSLSLLQQIFPIQEQNRGLLHCRRIVYQLIYQGSLYHLTMEEYKFLRSHGAFFTIDYNCLTITEFLINFKRGVTQSIFSDNNGMLEIPNRKKVKIHTYVEIKQHILKYPMGQRRNYSGNQKIHLTLHIHGFLIYEGKKRRCKKLKSKMKMEALLLTLQRYKGF